MLQHVSTSEALGEFITEHRKRRRKQGQDIHNMLILDPDFHDYAISYTDKVSALGALYAVSSFQNRLRKDIDLSFVGLPSM